jgi:hypothetical protein
MFKFLRISILLYILAFVAVSTFVTRHEAKQWDRPLLVRVYAVRGDSSSAVADEIAALETTDFDPLHQFFAAEGSRYGIGVDEPFQFELDTTTLPSVPAIPEEASLVGIMSWSLRMRWLVTKLNWQDEVYAPDITLFAVYHGDDETLRIDRSTALQKGLIAVANVFAHPDYAGSNAIVIGHELLHTLGATDKYAPATNQPTYPDGFAAPDASPLYPQPHAELMAGRRPVSATTAEMPTRLRDVSIGRLTAAEIGWIGP